MYKIQVKLTNMKLNRKITKQIPSFCIRQPCRRYYNRSRKFRSRMNQKTVNYFFELRHLRSVSSNNNNLVYCTFSRIKLYFTQQYSRDTTTCFGPIMWVIFTQYQKKTPHTSCIAAPVKLDRNLKMAHIQGRNMQFRPYCTTK